MIALTQVSTTCADSEQTMTSAQVVKKLVNVITNSPSQDYMYTHPDGHNLLTYDMTPGFKPFTA